MYVLRDVGAMESGIQLLEIASGLKESLLRAGFTKDSIISEGSLSLYRRILNIPASD
jgi:hypothetical protein